MSDDTMPADGVQQGLLLLRPVTTASFHSQIPRRFWANASKTERRAYMANVRGNLLNALEDKYPDHFYDFVNFTVTDPPQDGSRITMAPDKTLQLAMIATCVANVYAPAFVEPSADARQAFMKWAAGILAPPYMQKGEDYIVQTDAETVLEKLSDAWAQGTRPQEGEKPS